MLSKIANLIGVFAFTLASAVGATLLTSAHAASPAMADWHEKHWCDHHPHDPHCHYHAPVIIIPHCGRHHHLHHGHCVHD